MNHINDAIVTPDRIQKAFRINPSGVVRLAKFVCVDSVDAWRVFEGCQQQRVMAWKHEVLRITDRRAK
jgi:hypothetical protein